MAKPPLTPRTPLTLLSTLLPRLSPLSPLPPPSSHPPNHSHSHAYHSHSHAYHSHSHPHPAPPPFPRPETAILTAALPHVPAHGFTRSALALGARDAGYVGVAANLFPGGAVALVRFHLVMQRRALKGGEGEGDTGVNGGGGDVAVSRGGEARRTSVEEEVARLVWKRLVGNEAVVHRWPEALAVLALPANVPTAVRELALLADEILYLAGDGSVDTEWYTKRAALSAIYAACELFMTQDASPGFVETEAFLVRRLEGAGRARDGLGMLGSWVGMQGFGLLNTLRSKGVRI